ncbi:PKD domain-containing protein [Polaribacter butkevichii]|uniref:PKD domain-containing protein n=1 Tax=Polaribacter butkevichii TaxID=218490 RepID=UPI001474B4F7|nr:PKD domain-containing protein [Polaribacter butkevichii]
MKIKKPLSFNHKRKIYYISFLLICGVLLNTYADLSNTKLVDFLANVPATVYGSTKNTIKPTVAPTVSFTFTNNNACSGEEIQFTSDVSGATGDLTYSWDFGDGITSDEENPIHIFEALGCAITLREFEVKLTVTDDTGIFESTPQKVSVIEKPGVEFIDLALNNFNNCGNTSSTSAEYKITVDKINADACITNISIDWGDGTSGVPNATFPITHTYTKVGGYQMKITTTGTNGCLNEKIYQVSNASNPGGGFESPGSTSNLCAPTAELEFGITNWGENSDDTEYIVDFGDGTVETFTHNTLKNSPSYNPTNPENSTTYPVTHAYTTGSCSLPDGKFTAVLTVKNACDSTDFSISNISVLETSEAKFDADELGCVDTSISFKNTTIVGDGIGCSSTANFSWDFGDGTPIVNRTSKTNVPHTYTSPGKYMVTLKVTSTCGSNEYEKEICIIPKMTPLFIVDNEEGCIPLKISATNKTDTSNVCNVLPTYLWTVNYVADNCGITADWEFLNGTNETSENPQFNFKTPGKYTLTQEITTTCGKEKATKIIDVKKPPTVNINDIADICVNTTIAPTATIENCTSDASEITYNWTFTGGSPASATSLIPGDITYATPGVYTVTLKINSACGTVTAINKTFEVYEIPVITNTVLTQEICSTQTSSEITLMADDPRTTFSWSAIASNSNISGFTASGTSNKIPAEKLTNSGNSAGTVTYTAVPKLGPCEGTPVNFTVTVNPSQEITTQPTSYAICLGDAPTNLEVNYNNGAGNIQWYSNTSNTTTGGNIINGATSKLYIPTVTNTGIIYYYAKITFPPGICSSTLTTNIASVTVNETPAIADAEISISSGDTFNFDPSIITSNTVPTNTKYTWSTPTFSPSGAITGASAANTPQDKISQTLNNTITANVTVTYTITPINTATCTGIPFTLKVIITSNISSNPIITDNTCFESNDGKIEVTISGGVPFTTGNAYNISWTGPNGFTANTTTITNLKAGDYTLIVEDQYGTSDPKTYTVKQPEAIKITTDLEKNISCFNGNDGTINVSVSGGTAPYTYNWTTTDGSGIVLNSEDQNTLTAGTYNLEIIDVNNCTTSTSFTLSQPIKGLEIADSKQDIASCFGDSTGAIDINITGGTAPYSYNWTTTDGSGLVANAEDQNNLTSGTYNVTVTDNLGCSTNESFTINELSTEIMIAVTKTDIDPCMGVNYGEITVNPSGGQPPYSISWNHLANGFSLSNLDAGTYIATITDANNCTKEETIIITQPNFNANATVTNPICNGDKGAISLNINGGIAPITVTWDDDATAGIQRNNLSGGTYTVHITDNNPANCPIQRTFTIIDPPAIAISSTVIDDTDCNLIGMGSIDLDVAGGVAPYTFLWSNGETTEDVTNLSAGDYSVEITDTNGCSTTEYFNIFRQTPLSINFEETVTPDCDLKTVSQTTTAKVTGGFLPYTYTWSDGSVSALENSIMTTDQNGSYTLTITDAKGCTESKSVLIDLPSIGNIDFNYNSFTLNEYNLLSMQDPIQFTNLSTGNYTNLSWDFGDGSPIVRDENPIHTYDKVGTFTVTLKADFEPGCTVIQERVLNITKGYLLVNPTAFTPNNDGYNETIRPSYRGLIEIEMTIYNTWGIAIYYEKDINLELKGWDGTVKGKLAENGNYIMLVKGLTFYNTEITSSTPITLIK